MSSSGSEADAEIAVAGRWAVNSVCRLRGRRPGVSPKVLTRTLRRLEEHGFVTRTVFPAVPAKVEYELTDLGRGAARPLAQLRDWVETHVDRTQPELHGMTP